MFSNAQENENDGFEVPSRLFGFLILGVALVFIGIVILVFASVVLGGAGNVGVVIFVGPFPLFLARDLMLLG